MRVPRAAIAATIFVTATFITTLPAAQPVQAGGGAPKVAIIVGPVGGPTDNYRERADRVADEASDAGATVAKAYSPNATWANVRDAVSGANIIVYFGHGNGYPNPYTVGHEWTDRVNGWGLNMNAGEGDDDTINETLVYCGEKALLGTLGSGDGATQRQYCAGGPIDPAPGFVMVYGQAHYAPGFGERYDEDDPLTTLAQAQERVRNYSFPGLALGGSAFFATAYGDSHEIVTRLLTDPSTFGEIFASGEGYSPSTLTASAHPDIGWADYWVQRTVIGPSFHFGDPDYWYAFAGDPDMTMAEAGGMSGIYFTDIADSAFRTSILWMAEEGITSGCGGGKFCPKASVTREQMASFLVRALDPPSTSTDFFTDDDASPHENDINRLAASGITGGCAEGRFCPKEPVTREQMASFLARALKLPGTSTDFFADDAGSVHENDINRLAASGITGGCGTATFCPSAKIVREQMAAFLYRARDLIA